ncbi:hypothetical protein DMH15_35215 [Streptomyces sp. WAC 06725]|uniref:hypothetical protein n=1 Tax=Streptomyces sp. WAC 06725 TaxID=2203209 RepID=UPI000F737840|nr:hypothetical protein [Streptomyces sp. WAC 06725]RSO21547.1 hypothetical protein DMH15_35215 [Streptomyces sp. WAC 06725]
MPDSPPAHITLAFSRSAGIVAIPTGRQYRWAETALSTSGFQRRDDGTFALPVGDPQAARTTVPDLIRAAQRHQTTVKASTRRFLGDVAQDFADQLRGTWTVKLEVYSHPLWQEDLVPWLWDCGELSQAVQNLQVPYAAVLSNDADITLLLIERPGHQHGYVVGAFAPDGFTDNYHEPHAPRSIVVPAAAGLAGRLVTDRFLPAYHQALLARRTTTVEDALARIREEYQTWQAMVASGRASDASPLGPGSLHQASAVLHDLAWWTFRDVLIHGPALLERCPPDAASRRKEADALERLRSALHSAQSARAEWNDVMDGLRQSPDTQRVIPFVEAEAQRDSRVWPAIETWLKDGDVLLQQARAACGGPPRPLRAQETALSATAPALPAPSAVPDAAPRR